MRAPNSIDFWRGYALITIFITHVPGNIFERYTLREYSLSDSAELFVFLAGVSLRFVVDSLAKQPLAVALYRLGGRALTIYFAQLIITFLAIAILAGAATLLDQPYILQWHNAAAVFDDPVEAHIGLIALRYQLGYFNILPLYVVLMASAPTLAVIHRLTPWLVLPLSLTLYLYTIATGFNLPTWPVEGNWFFSPSAWQFIFVLGFLFSGPNGYYARMSPRVKNVLFVAAGLQTALGAAIAIGDVSPDPANLPDPKLFFVFDKTYLSPARAIHCLALACFFGGAFTYIQRYAGFLAKFFSMLGRNSLNVFCVASLLSLCGQVARYAFNGRWEIDWLVLGVGAAGLGFTAWLTEWRQRHGGRAKSVPAPEK
ncbi:hypothetical protein SAMN06265338_104139 [Rhodoblastus acidophilus]|uniref:OpgC domain-containing protein n=1 Tax=Rhodoblastus acidophilus TaxID=1074 RepID=A0A212RGF3_RHOAC|nr:OpgC domain-containing protein [Rhodoblastus acidophilus]MCW2316916.1 hypothetical protein [Rhodoblastus acidophilus]PPQ39616.1 OpgC protein [Rhodoblastus acidophilus]RAI24398.1 OpgC protein [Rhodoblastus acidophilus]SNB71378.1 hypothetical protein SAMN06265338_104139 [Rhodoblastus acidophilus]